MVLSRDVNLANQVKLCGKGTTLDDMLIQRLEVRGIRRVFVRGRPIPGPNAEERAAIEARVADRFSHVQHLPHMVDVQRAVERLLRKRWSQ